MQQQQGNVFIPLVIGIFLFIVFGLGYYYYFHQTKVLQNNTDLIQNLSENFVQTTPKEPSMKEASSWETFCDGYYLSDDTGSIVLNRNYDLKELEQTAKEQRFMTLYNPERFHEGGPLQSVIEKNVPIKKNSTVVHNGVTYKTTEEGYEAFAPQLRIQKVINGGTYRITLAHHWNLEGSQSASLTTDSLEIPVMGGQKTDRVSDEDIISHFKDILSDLEIESEFLGNIRINRNACAMPATGL